MESRIRKKIETHTAKFKNDIKNKMSELNMLNDEKEKDLLQYIFEYERVTLIKVIFLKKKLKM